MSRELDLLIAENIFGITKVYHLPWDSNNAALVYIPSGKPWRTHQIDAKPLPSFSTHPSASYQVILKMSEQYHWIIKSPFEINSPWVAGLTPLGITGWNGLPDFQVTGKTEMEVVCKVALATLENKLTQKLKIIEVKE